MSKPICEWETIKGYACHQCGDAARVNPENGAEWGCATCGGSSVNLVANFDRVAGYGAVPMTASTLGVPVAPPAMPEYDSTKRVAECADPDCTVLRSIEVSFAIPCYVTQAQQRALFMAVNAIISAPCNQVTDGCHWLGEYGARPKWSRADAAMLGVAVDADAPESGEPTFDDSVLSMASTARGFVSEKERTRKAAERAKPARAEPTVSELQVELRRVRRAAAEMRHELVEGLKNLVQELAGTMPTPFVTLSTYADAVAAVEKYDRKLIGQAAEWPTPEKKP